MSGALINLLNQPQYKRAVRNNNGKAVPEARPPPLITGGLLLTAWFFWLGWTAAPKHMWMLPVVAGGMYPPLYPSHNPAIQPGLKLMSGQVLSSRFRRRLQQCLNFLVDAYGPYAANAVSANTILRTVLACALPIAARPMFVNMGVAPAASLLGGISCLALPVPFLFMRYTWALWRKSRFASSAK